MRIAQRSKDEWVFRFKSSIFEYIGMGFSFDLFFSKGQAQLTVLAQCIFFPINCAKLDLQNILK